MPRTYTTKHGKTAKMQTQNKTEEIVLLLLDVATRLREIAAEQARQGALTETILRGLDRGRGARDHADATLLLAVAEAVGDRGFKSGEVISHAAADLALREALTSADVTNAQELGCVLRRLEGVAVNGLRLERSADSRAGVVWSVHVCGD